MANISDIVNINSGDAVLASVVSGNFSEILVAVNSNALDSDNYGQSSVLSQHISTNAILSQHISNSQIVSGKISDNAVVHDKLNFASASDGVRVLQIGAASSDLPANGVAACRLSNTQSLDSTSQLTVTLLGVMASTATPPLLRRQQWEWRLVRSPTLSTTLP